MKKKCDHDWIDVGSVRYHTWTEVTCWCRLCGTIRKSTYDGNVRYRRPKYYAVQ